MKLLVTGSEGQLGSDVLMHGRKAGYSCYGVKHSEVDITDQEAVTNLVHEIRPDVVVHCAAYNAVDKAEEEPALCFLVNVQGTANLAKACQKFHAKMIHVSTDYVFDGTKSGLYETTDEINPLSVYGRSKGDGESVVRNALDRFFIVRTSWLFGRNGTNFVKKMMELARDHEEIRVVQDQFGSPTYTSDLALFLLELAKTDRFGIYHATNEGFCSWFEFASKILSEIESPCKVAGVKTSEYPVKALRPQNSRLSKASLTDNGFDLLPPWENALTRFICDLES